MDTHPCITDEISRCQNIRNATCHISLIWSFSLRGFQARNIICKNLSPENVAKLIFLGRKIVNAYVRTYEEPLPDLITVSSEWRADDFV